MSAEVIHKKYRTGQEFTVDGYYKYAGHAEHYGDCYVPSQSFRMFFRSGQKVPSLPSCTHEVYFELVEPYKG